MRCGINSRVGLWWNFGMYRQGMMRPLHASVYLPLFGFGWNFLRGARWRWWFGGEPTDREARRPKGDQYYREFYGGVK